MTYVSVDQLQYTALQLKAEGTEPNCAQIAKRMGKTQKHIRHLVWEKYQGYGLEKVIVKSVKYSLKKAPNFSALRIARQKVAAREGIVCTGALSREVGWNRRRLTNYLNRYPLLANELSLVTDFDAHIWNLSCRLLNEGKKLTREVIADAAHCPYDLVRDILHRHPAWIEDLGICRADRGSGVFIRQRKKLAG